MIIIAISQGKISATVSHLMHICHTLFQGSPQEQTFYVTEKIAVIFQPELIHWKKRVCCQVQLRMLASGFFQKDKGENCEARNDMKKQKCKDCSLISLLYFLNKQIGIQQPTFC